MSTLVAAGPARRRCFIATARESSAAGQPLTTEELTKFFSILSHDLKSPIFAVDGFSELLISDYSDKLDEDGQDFLRRIRTSVQHMKKVLDDMSHMVKMLARDTVKRPAPLGEIVQEVLLKHNFMIEEGGVRVDVPANLPTLNVDPEKMREALSVIVANALFFTDRPNGERTVAIECTRTGDGHRICVLDNGVGIDPRYVQQVFDLGGVSKLDKQRPGSGPGYGLYLAKRLIESQGGSVTVESKPGEGSTFCLKVPS
ncbi:MAG TPA: ATP-binding protein [Thermoanaerobaculia bacterium]|nr:ATP-binding protein [Thermoanaerobaculia bacterium]